MESFSLFCHFPGELQLAIWEFAAIQPDIPEPEVCLAWPLNIEYDSRPPEDPVLPFTVDTAWPGVAHACRASREAFLASSRAVRYSPAAGFAVPYRRFIPAIDTLYLGQAQISAVLRFLSRPENLHIARDLHHLAVELSTSGSTLLVIGRQLREGLACPCIRTLSIVVPGTMDSPSHKLHVPFLPPERRCRLRDIPNETLNDIKIIASGKGLMMSLQEHLDRRWGTVHRWVRDHPLGPVVRHSAVDEWADHEGTAWSTENGWCVGLELKAQTFVEYRSINNQEQWVEVCQDRLLGEEAWPPPRPRRIAAADRKNPEKYRVLDDDSRMPSREE